MNRSASVFAIVIAGGLTLAGCSGSPDGSTANGPAAGSSIPMMAAAIEASAGQQLTAATDSAVITVQAVGTVTGTPDLLTVTLGVETNAAAAQGALDENNRLAADVIAVLKDKGVAPEDLQTSQLSISPSFDSNNQITGYQVTNLVTARLRDIAAAGALIDAVGGTAGDAVRVQQISFSIDDDSALRATARADAVRQAQAQAGQLAEAAGVSLGAIRSITEIPGSGGVPYPAAFDTGAAASAAVPIEAGSQELQVSVQVVYEIA